MLAIIAYCRYNFNQIKLQKQLTTFKRLMESHDSKIYIRELNRVSSTTIYLIYKLLIVHAIIRQKCGQTLVGLGLRTERNSSYI